MIIELTTISGIMFSTFQGEVRMETQQVIVQSHVLGHTKPRFDIDRGGYPSSGSCTDSDR